MPNFNVTFLGGSSSIFRLEIRTIFSGKRNPIFTDDAGNTIFQCNIFGKAISHEHFGKKNWFLVKCYLPEMKGP